MSLVEKRKANHLADTDDGEVDVNECGGIRKRQRVPDVCRLSIIVLLMVLFFCFLGIDESNDGIRSIVFYRKRCC